MSVRDSLDLLRRWAATGGTLEGVAPVDDAELRLAAPAPETGEIEWALPPSYRELLAVHSRLLIKWGPNRGHSEFIILSPKEIGKTSGIVYLPDGVSRDPGKELSTNHLVPFASGGDDECAFCFDVTRPDAAGEYPVYFHHQDEPRARYVEDGAWEDPDNETPDFASFAEWLAWVAAELTAGREPPHSRPTSFDEMRARDR